MSHASAGLKEYGRNLAVERYLAGDKVEDIAGQLGIRRTTVDKWIARDALEGPAGWWTGPAGRTAAGAGSRSLSTCESGGQRGGVRPLAGQQQRGWRPASRPRPVP